MQINQAHAIMLARCGIIKKDHGTRILGGLRRITAEQKKLQGYCFCGAEEDLFFYVESCLASHCGPDIAGHLSAARSRNDVDITLYRMVLRNELLQTAVQIDELQQVLLRLAEAHTKTIFPVVTHTQLAQPTTLGHYLMAAVEFLERDLRRLSQSFRSVNHSPLGACVATTTGFPIDRRLLARLLGFEAVLENAYGCIASVDYLVESVGTISTLMVNLGKFIQDLLLWSSQESALMVLPDGFVQCSSIMPQKRNPVALEHLRILASNAIGQCQAVVLGLHNTPFGDIVDAEDDIQPAVRASFEYAARVLKLLTAVLDSAEFNVERALAKCQSGEVTLTELADWLVRRHQLPFRMAHRIVSQVGQELRRHPARRQGESQSQWVSDLLEIVSKRLTGKVITIPPQRVAEILDPVGFVMIRKVVGGPSPAVVARSIARHIKRANQHKRWLAGKKDLLATYVHQLNKL